MANAGDHDAYEVFVVGCIYRSSFVIFCNQYMFMQPYVNDYCFHNLIIRIIIILVVNIDLIAFEA